MLGVSKEVAVVMFNTPGARLVTLFVLWVKLKDVFHWKSFPLIGVAFKVTSIPLLYIVPTFCKTAFGIPVEGALGTFNSKPSMSLLYQANSPVIALLRTPKVKPISVFLLVSHVRRLFPAWLKPSVGPPLNNPALKNE